MTATAAPGTAPGPASNGAAATVPATVPAATVPAPGVALALDRVTVAYGRGAPVVDDISFTVETGRWLALIGPNGAGKSSLLKAVAGLVVHGGTVTVAAEGVLSRRPADNRRRARVLAYVAQHPVLPPGMTVAEYVLLGRTAHLRWLATEGPRDHRIVAQVLERLALTPFASRPLTDLSGGEVQRVALARALAQQAAIILLDEPTSALDIGHRVAVLELVDELRRQDGLTVVSALHDLGSAGRFADQLVLLHEGRMAAQGPPAEVLTETTLSRYYQTPVQVLTGSDGGVVVVPLRTSRTPHESSRP